MIRWLQRWWCLRKHARDPCLLCGGLLGDGGCVYMDQESNGVRAMEGYAHWSCVHRYLYGYELGQEGQQG